MGAYVEWDDLTALIPECFAVEGLDDDDDSQEDAWAKVQEQACKAVDACLQPLYSSPVAKTPLVCRAATLFAAAIVYNRRGCKDEDFPYREQLAKICKKLEKIGCGDLPLTPDLTPTHPPVSVIKCPSKTHSKCLNV